MQDLDLWLTALTELWLSSAAGTEPTRVTAGIGSGSRALLSACSTVSNAVNLKILSLKRQQGCLQLWCSEAPRRGCSQPWHHCWSLALAASRAAAVVSCSAPLRRCAIPVQAAEPYLGGTACTGTCPQDCTVLPVYILAQLELIKIFLSFFCCHSYPYQLTVQQVFLIHCVF